MTKARDLANSAAAFSAVSATELGYVDGVTSAIQTQLDAKAASSTAVTLTGTQTLTNKTLTSPVIASVINNTLTSTTGDIIYASAANTPARLGIGSSAQVLTVASGLPAWSTPAGGGKVLQVVSATTTTDTTIATTAWQDSGISVTITPTLNTSKIMIISNAAFTITDSPNSSFLAGGVRLMRGATAIGTPYNPSNEVGVTFYGSGQIPWGFSYLDSPATTSATTYKIQGKVYVTTSGRQLNFQSGTAQSNIIALEIGA